MKTLKTTLATLLITAAFISCSKDGKSPDTTSVTPPLVTQMVVTYSNLRLVYNNTYDDKKGWLLWPTQLSQ